MLCRPLRTRHIRTFAAKTGIWSSLAFQSEPRSSRMPFQRHFAILEAREASVLEYVHTFRHLSNDLGLKSLHVVVVLAEAMQGRLDWAHELNPALVGVVYLQRCDQVISARDQFVSETRERRKAGISEELEEIVKGSE
jgi:hypothetical protein